MVIASCGSGIWHFACCLCILALKIKSVAVFPHLVITSLGHCL
jgi:hypothetical protein